MINFFRKIRKRLFNENRFAKYLLYAIGEIALIMVGILLALQIGIWNENKKNIKTENTYLTGILNNLNEDVEELKKLRTKDTLQLDAITTILKSFSDETINRNIPELSNAALYFYATSDFKGNNLTFEDMKYSGKTSLIRSNSLRLKILDYYSEFERYKSIEQRNNDIVIKSEEGVISDVLDFNSIYEKNLPEQWSSPINNLDLSIFDRDANSEQVRDFANNLTGIKLMYLANHIEKIKLSKKAESLISDIEKYMNK